MDETLEALRRAAEADPGDQAAAQAYEAALRRAGRGEDLRQRYRFRFLCGQDWDRMTPGASPDRRRCAACRRDVVRVDDEASFVAAVARGECVSVAWRVAERLVDGLADSGRLPSSRASEACVVPLPDLAPPPPARLMGAPLPLPPPPR